MTTAELVKAVKAYALEHKLIHPGIIGTKTLFKRVARSIVGETLTAKSIIRRWHEDNKLKGHPGNSARPNTTGGE